MADRPVAIVTGGSRGIGRGIAMELARLGYDLVINHIGLGQSTVDRAQQVQSEIESLGSTCKVVRGDISNAQDRSNIKEITAITFGRCDMLVNNAGVAPEKRLDILEATEESFERVLRINLKGPYFLSQLIANWMIEQKEKFPDREFRIVNISSISAYTSSPSRGEYCVSKAGITMMTALYADRLAEFGIGVFEIQPGITETDMTGAVKDKYDKLIAEGLTPIKRWGKPEDVGKAVGAIALGKLDFCTGQVINCDGGFHLRRL